MGLRTTGIATRLLGMGLAFVLTTGQVIAATTATPTPTAGVSSERGLVSFLVFLVLIGGLWLYLRRRG